MKKLITLIALLLITLTISACSNESDTFTLENFSIISIFTELNEKPQYNSDNNATTTNTTLFTNCKNVIGDHEVTMFDDSNNVTKDVDKLIITIETSNGSLYIYSATYVVDDEDTTVTIVEFNENSMAYADVDMYDELLLIFN